MKIHFTITQAGKNNLKLEIKREYFRGYSLYFKQMETLKLYQKEKLKSHVVKLKLNESMGLMKADKQKLERSLIDAQEIETYLAIKHLNNDELLTLIINEVLK